MCTNIYLQIRPTSLQHTASAATIGTLLGMQHVTLGLHAPLPQDISESLEPVTAAAVAAFQLVLVLIPTVTEAPCPAPANVGHGWGV